MKFLQRRQFLHLAAGAAALPSVLSIARAQNYPSRPITIIGPYAAGGSTDVIARTLADRMRGSLGQPVIVENVVGAGGSIGVSRAARSAPDGYTLSIGQWGSHVVNGAIFTLQYDLLNDLVPVSLLVDSPLMISAKKALPANDLKEFIAWLKANPEKASSGNAGIGSAAHIAALFFQNVTGTRFGFVPYRGGAPAIQDMVAGHIDFMIGAAADALPQVRSGNLKALGVTAKTRLASAPNIPSVDEAGLSGFYVSLWHGLWVPKGTPENIIGKLNAAVRDALADATVRTRLADLGQEFFPAEQLSPGSLGAFHKAEIEKWWPIIKAANIKAE